jgi:two-component system, LuxR family, response regulator FixJ
MNSESDEKSRRQKVYVVDDDASARESLCWLLDTEGIETESFDSAESFLEQWSPDWAGCITADIRMPGKSGLQMQATLNEHGNRLPIIVLTGHADVPIAIRAMKQGAYEFLQKPYSDEELLACVNGALELDRDTYRSQRDRLTAMRAFEHLTERERVVMRLVVDGLTNKSIAAQLGISEKTVEVHRARSMEKMGAKTLPELVRIGMLLDERL